MEEIKKVFNSKSVFIAVIIISICLMHQYAYPDSNGYLRIPIGDYNREYQRMNSERIPSEVPWYKKKVDIALFVDIEKILWEKHEGILKMANEIELATEGRMKGDNIKDFDYNEYINAIEAAKEISETQSINGPEDLEQAMFKFQFLVRESANRVNDHWGGYYNQSAIPIMKKILKEIFEKSTQDTIKQDPLVFAVKVFIKMVAAQPFYEGNHRTADFLMNFILLHNGLPMFILTPDNVIEYYQLANTKTLQSEDNFDKVLLFFRKEIEKLKELKDQAERQSRIDKLINYVSLLCRKAL